MVWWENVNNHGSSGQSEGAHSTQHDAHLLLGWCKFPLVRPATRINLLHHVPPSAHRPYDRAGLAVRGWINRLAALQHLPP